MRPRREGDRGENWGSWGEGIFGTLTVHPLVLEACSSEAQLPPMSPWTSGSQPAAFAKRRGGGGEGEREREREREGRERDIS